MMLRNGPKSFGARCAPLLFALALGCYQSHALRDAGTRQTNDAAVTASVDAAPLCPAPYRVQTAEGNCVWSCGAGTHPGSDAECECDPGLMQTGTDSFGRRICG